MMESDQRGFVNFELQLSIAIGVVGLSLVIPSICAVLDGTQQIPDAVLLIGTIIGSLAAWLGSVAIWRPQSSVFGLIWLGSWTLVGIGFAVAAGLGVVFSSEWWRKLLFASAALLPLLGPGRVWVDIWRDR
ncbi:MAG: hypothetical protein AB1646_11185 [Thermodesulfobacteriota bacterium]